MAGEGTTREPVSLVFRFVFSLCTVRTIESAPPPAVWWEKRYWNIAGTNGGTPEMSPAPAPALPSECNQLEVNQSIALRAQQ